MASKSQAVESPRVESNPSPDAIAQLQELAAQAEGLLGELRVGEVSPDWQLRAEEVYSLACECDPRVQAMCAVNEFEASLRGKRASEKKIASALASRDFGLPLKGVREKRISAACQTINAKLRRILDTPFLTADVFPKAAEGISRAVETLKRLLPVQADATAAAQPAFAAGHLHPTDLIKTAVAVKEFSVSLHTLYRGVDDGRIKDWRLPGHGNNAPLQLSRAEVEKHWPRR